MSAEQGNVIAFRNPIQALVYTDFLVPELRKGHWASATPRGHADDWASAEAKVDEGSVGRNFDPAKVNYDLLNKDFVDSIADRAIRRLKAKVGIEVTPRDLRRELRDMMFIMRTPMGRPLATSHQGMMSRPGRPSKVDLEGLYARSKEARSRSTARRKAQTKAVSQKKSDDVRARRLAGLEKARAAKAAKRGMAAAA
jgi:hypothetical protein